MNRSLRIICLLAVAGAWLVAGVFPCLAGEKDEWRKAGEKVQTKRFSRNMKKLGQNVNKPLLTNTKSMKRGKHRYSSRSFSSRAYKSQSSSTLRELHQRSFHKAPTAVVAKESKSDVLEEDEKPSPQAKK